MQTKVLKVDVTVNIKSVIETICAKFDIPDADRFCLSTVGVKPNLLLDDTVPLVVYGA